ncbi:hypothetical protein SDC9_171525 [bioreactor metagenome]|uniref:Uncharacterized protein n=1 Tax=bioreactor metagenome TaxID=1076179 RepID=A0A645GB50_9ZZZZ
MSRVTEDCIARRVAQHAQACDMQDGVVVLSAIPEGLVQRTVGRIEAGPRHVDDENIVAVTAASSRLTTSVVIGLQEIDGEQQGSRSFEGAQEWGRASQRYHVGQNRRLQTGRKDGVVLMDEFHGIHRCRIGYQRAGKFSVRRCANPQ